MGSLLEALQAREAADRTRVEALRAAMDRLAEQLAAEQALLGRLGITRQTVIEILAGEELPGGDAVVADRGPAPEAGVGRRGWACRFRSSARTDRLGAGVASGVPGRGGGAGRCRGGAACQAGVP